MTYRELAVQEGIAKKELERFRIRLASGMPRPGASPLESIQLFWDPLGSLGMDP